MMDFLYFPEDKTEYIPAVITLLIFMLGAAITMYIFYKYSKREEQRINEKYNLNDDNNDKTNTEDHGDKGE
ncbi:hypothetical protein CFK37_12325 [Virgibacillus phasianinus]|uniref:Uncharacterized protein n=1 Tax=Virgibacillus phasianinus TaxID=2017483 RepID=A0A220U441_9BACI|nr:hypothetical protein [Virgibacillus phasianinus]ASK62877.1 hypothetical protein CFK37_12325 [Virgibacillus phasianinus]